MLFSYFQGNVFILGLYLGRHFERVNDLFKSFEIKSSLYFEFAQKFLSRVSILIRGDASKAVFSWQNEF